MVGNGGSMRWPWKYSLPGARRGLSFAWDRGGKEGRGSVRGSLERWSYIKGHLESDEEPETG